MLWYGRNYAYRKLDQTRFNVLQFRHSILWHGRNLRFWLLSSAANSIARLCTRLIGDNIAAYALVQFSEYLTDPTKKYRIIVAKRELDIAIPDVQPEQFRKFFYGNSRSLQVPPITAFEVSNVQVMGKSDLLFLDDRCLHHQMYRFDQDFLFEEMHDIVSINAAAKMLIRLKGQKIGSIPAGISLVGSATSNYVHWLTETLPKLALIDGIEVYRDLPYILDEGLHPNIMESVRHLNFEGREVILLGRGEMLFVEKLIAISPVAYVPFDFKPGINPDKLDINPSSALYSPDALQLVRKLLVTRLGEITAESKRRLFLRRTGKSRPMINATEIEAMLQEQGFEIIEPEALSFADQVRLFSNAELIVSQGGAALGNIIFAPAGCHVIVLTTWSPYTIHYYFANLAALLGQRCTLIMCEPVQGDLGPHRAHMGVNVSIPILIKAIQQ